MKKAAREEGLAIGRTEGRAEGQTEKTLEIARNLLAEGSSLELVQKTTNLDIQTIRELISR